MSVYLNRKIEPVKSNEFVPILTQKYPCILRGPTKVHHETQWVTSNGVTTSDVTNSGAATRDPLVVDPSKTSDRLHRLLEPLWGL